MKWKVLHELYPFDESFKRALISAIGFGLFVFLFLHFFQPFGLSNYRSDQKTMQLFGYGLVTFITLIGNYSFFSLVFPKWFNKASWTILKNIIYTTWMFFSIGLGNLLFSVSQQFLSLDIDGFLFYQGMTLLVGVFPVTLSTLIIYHKRLKNMVNKAEGLNDTLLNNKEVSKQLIIIPSQNKSEKIEININELLAIKAVENYVELYSMKDEKLSKYIVRNTLSNVANSLIEFDFVKKCHRSYLVNLQKVKHFTGNAQGLSLDFENKPSLVVPVSRSFVKESGSTRKIKLVIRH